VAAAKIEPVTVTVHYVVDPDAMGGFLVVNSRGDLLRVEFDRAAAADLAQRAHGVVLALPVVDDFRAGSPS
jgi:hypothetical protein